jgi:hypothetical protein
MFSVANYSIIQNHVVLIEDQNNSWVSMSLVNSLMFMLLFLLRMFCFYFINVHSLKFVSNFPVFNL